MPTPSSSKQSQFPKQTARTLIYVALAAYAEQHWRSPWKIDGQRHRRSEPQDYDPTPACTECHLAWDETGNIKPEYRCPASPGAIVDAATRNTEDSDV